MMSIHISILTLGFISGIRMQMCPEPEDLFPCKCLEGYRNKEIRVECTSDLFAKLHDLEKRLPLKLLQPALNSLRGKNSLHLIFKNIMTTLPSNFFSGINITRLEFHSCSMDSLTNDDLPGLLGLEDLLEELRIYGSSLVPAELNIGHLKKLGKLTLERNTIPELRNDWLSSAPHSLKTLYFIKNNITKIGSHAFSQLNYLELLSLDDNRLGFIKRSMFPKRPYRLQFLRLNNNSLTELPANLFSRLPSIKDISLYGNGITTLDEGTWSPVWKQLDDIDVEGNNIYCDERLRWISKYKYRPFVLGECSYPKEFEGISLDEFFKIQSQRNISGVFT